MNLLEMKKKTLKLIEEVSTDGTKLTDDPDIEAKLNEVINQVQYELARMKKIPAVIAQEITSLTLDLKTIKNFYQLDNLRFRNTEGEELETDIYGTNVVFPEEGTATIYYFKYPERITDDTNDSEYIFELTDDALEILPYGAAADLLKSDVSNNYGQIYAQRYSELKQLLDPRYSMGSVYIEGGFEI